MRLPRAVARLNRYGINQITRHFAGRVPPFAMLVHRGRRSGREYRTPIMAFPCDGGFVIALTYGRGTDWERNMQAAGGGELIYGGRRYLLGAPGPIEVDRAGRCLPAIVRAALRLMRVDAYLHCPAAVLG